MKKQEKIATTRFIDQYLDGTLSEVEIDEFETKCLEDRTFFQQVQARARFRKQIESVVRKNGAEIFFDHLKQLPELAATNSVNRRLQKMLKFWDLITRSRKYWLVPASAIIILVVLYFTPTEEAFQKNSALEKDLEITRSAADEVEILSPQKNEVLYGKVEFNWQTDMNKLFELEILDNKSRVIDSTKTYEKSFTFAGALTPGLYYWRLYAGEYLVYIGKFKIKKK